jgi:hypothetical protein
MSFDVDSELIQLGDHSVISVIQSEVHALAHDIRALRNLIAAQYTIKAPKDNDSKYEGVLEPEDILVLTVDNALMRTHQMLGAINSTQTVMQPSDLDRVKELGQEILSDLLDYLRLVGKPDNLKPRFRNIARELARTARRAKAIRESFDQATPESFAVSPQNSAVSKPTDSAVEPLAGSSQENATAEVTYSASRLLGIACLVLPAAHRSRYIDEYRSELWELARNGQSRQKQLAYACHQLMRCLTLRSELTVPLKGSAEP